MEELGRGSVRKTLESNYTDLLQLDSLFKRIKDFQWILDKDATNAITITGERESTSVGRSLKLFKEIHLVKRRWLKKLLKTMSEWFSSQSR